MASLNEFISNVKTKGMMRSNRYFVILPAGVCKSDDESRLVGLYCDQVSLPGLNISTTAHLTYGETREIPYQRLYSSITMSFFVDTDMKTKQYFDDWMSLIQNPMNRTFNYYDQYAKKVTINVEDLQNETKYSMNLYECYPKSIQDIQLDTSSKDLMKIQVTMAYRYWDTESRPNDSSPMIFNSTAAGIGFEPLGAYTGVSSPLSVKYNPDSVKKAVELANAVNTNSLEPSLANILR